MLLFEIIIALLLIGAVLALWADRIGVPYPALLALAGVVLALLPGTPHVRLDPELALALFVAPVLLDAAYDASPRDLKNNLLPVSSLAVVAVLVTVAAVAAVAHRIVPGIGWPAAVTLGAIVSPPDASAATAVLRRLRLPHRAVVVLEGESLFNDATALLIYRLAVAATLTGTLSGWHVVPMLAVVSVGSVLAGIALARAYLLLTARVRDIPISILLQFIGTFAVWVIANRAGLSAILTMIGYAMTLARLAPGRVDARRRISSYAVWEVAVFVLNVLAFVLIGLQLGEVLTRAERAGWRDDVLAAAAVCGTVIVVRFAWVMAHRAVTRWWFRRLHARPAPSAEAAPRPPPPSMGAAVVIAWCGMRGIVTLATALALPGADSASGAFPYRDTIIFCSFAVVLCTLVIQGATLRPLIQWLDLKDDGAVEREMMLARAATARAALRVLDGEADRPFATVLRREYEARLYSGERGLTLEALGESAGALVALQRRAVSAQRQTLGELRARNVIGDDAFHLLEEEIDLLELTADVRIRPSMEEGLGSPENLG